VSPEPTSDLIDPDSLQEYFAGRLPLRLNEIEEAARQVRESGWSAEEVKTFHRLAHSLAGAGATFGFPAVTEAARALEQRLKAVLHGGKPPLGDAEVEDLLSQLRSAAKPARSS
jgi:HPt (histidine-containing phosphotransfer) domain-containing protein